MRCAMLQVPKQHGRPICGPCALKVQMELRGRRIPLKKVIVATRCTRNGTLHRGLWSAARHFGFYTEVHENYPFSELVRRVNDGEPALVGYLLSRGDFLSDHFGVAYEISDGIVRLYDSETHLRDGVRTIDEEDFRKYRWCDTDEHRRVVHRWVMFIHGR